MARLQILELPEGGSDDRPPFVLVVDQAPTDVDAFDAFRRDLLAVTALTDRIGARAVLVFEETIDIPANDTGAYLRDGAQGEETQGHAAQGLRLAHERTAIARDMDRLASHKAALTDALGTDRLRDWDDIRNAARGLRRERDAQAEALERVRNLPEEPDCMDAQHPAPSGYLHGYSVAIRDAKRATYAFRAASADDQADSAKE